MGHSSQYVTPFHSQYSIISLLFSSTASTPLIPTLPNISTTHCHQIFASLLTPSSAWPPSGAVPLPEHYQLIAGYVSVTSRSTEQKDDCGTVTQITETITRDWAGYAYDILAQTIGSVKKVIFVTRGKSAITWDIGNAQRVTGCLTVAYASYGPIRAGLTYQIIAARGTTIAATGGNYVYVSNNCRTFAGHLYADISG